MEKSEIEIAKKLENDKVFMYFLDKQLKKGTSKEVVVEKALIETLRLSEKWFNFLEKNKNKPDLIEWRNKYMESIFKKLNMGGTND